MINKIIVILLTVVLLSGCAGDGSSSTVSSVTGSSTTASTPTDDKQSTPSESEPFDADKVREQLKAETYVMNLSVTLAGNGYVAVENPTEYNLTVTCDMVLKDVDGNAIAERSQTLNHLRPNSSTVFYVSEMGEFESTHPKAGSVEYTFTDITETVDHECPLANLEIKDYIDDNKHIVYEAKNTSTEEVVDGLDFIFLTFYENELSDRLIGEGARYLAASDTYVSEPMRGGNPVQSYLAFYYCEDIRNYK